MDRVEAASVPAIFFSKPDCPFCDKLEDDLKSLKIPYEKVMLDAAIRDEVIKATGLKTVPQLFMGKPKQFIGGYREFTILASNEARLADLCSEYGIIPYNDF